jgi:hypothetical protein
MRTRARFRQTSSTEPASQAREDAYAAGPLSEIDAAQEPESAAQSFTVSPGRRSQAKGSGRGSGRLVLPLPLAERTYPRPSNRPRRNEWSGCGSPITVRDANALRPAADEDERPAHLAKGVPYDHVAPLPRLATLARQLAEFAQVQLGVQLRTRAHDRPADVGACAPIRHRRDRRPRRPSGGNRPVITVVRCACGGVMRQ